jgi:hypothetical protein
LNTIGKRHLEQKTGLQAIESGPDEKLYSDMQETKRLKKTVLKLTSFSLKE